MTPFETRFKIRFGEVDQAGIAYYPNVLHYCHVVFEEFFEHRVGTPYHRIVGERHLGFPMVSLETTFHAPFRYGAEVRATLAVTRVGARSTDWAYEFHDAGDGTHLASSRNTTVAVDMRTFESRPVPDDLRSAFLSEDDEAA
ncbi:MAG: acyl-CoA thioesterase [Planctomycetota bacterium JB042]